MQPDAGVIGAEGAGGIAVQPGFQPQWRKRRDRFQPHPGQIDTHRQKICRFPQRYADPGQVQIKPLKRLIKRQQAAIHESRQHLPHMHIAQPHRQRTATGTRRQAHLRQISA